MSQQSTGSQQSSGSQEPTSSFMSFENVPIFDQGKAKAIVSKHCSFCDSLRKPMSRYCSAHRRWKTRVLYEVEKAKKVEKPRYWLGQKLKGQKDKEKEEEEKFEAMVKAYMRECRSMIIWNKTVAP